MKKNIQEMTSDELRREDLERRVRIARRRSMIIKIAIFIIVVFMIGLYFTMNYMLTNRF